MTPVHIVDCFVDLEVPPIAAASGTALAWRIQEGHVEEDNETNDCTRGIGAGPRQANVATNDIRPEKLHDMKLMEAAAGRRRGSLWSSEGLRPSSPLVVVERSIPQRVEALAELYQLSEKQARVLALIASGVHLKKIGEEIGCAYSSVRTHVRRLSSKMGCSGVREIILRFFDDFYISQSN